jgi:regulator of cell morphogenesis and NO signaling
MTRPELLNTEILDLVEQNTACAAVLHTFGLPFYQYPNRILKDVCQSRGLNPAVVAKHLEEASYIAPIPSRALPDYDVDVVIAYLKRSHGIFIRKQLPYMADLVAHIAPEHFNNVELAKDLKFVFPLFVEDFIHHIHEEEDTVFAYIARLWQSVNERRHFGRLFFDMKKHSVQAFADGHLEEDDEMRGIREMTDNYSINAHTSIYTKVIYKELQWFEAVLCSHAAIENDILVPKALRLEQRARRMMQKIAYYN